MAAIWLPCQSEGDGLRCRLFALLDERQQVGIDLVCVDYRHSVRKARIHLQCGVLHTLRGHQTRCTDRHDLIIIPVKNEGWHIELFEVLSEIRLGEGLDAVVVWFHSSQHALQPEVVPDAFGNLGAWPVVAEEWESKFLIKLRPICRKLSAQVIEDRDGQATGILVRL